MSTKGLPHDWYQEGAVLGGILLDASLLDDVRAELVAEDFHRPSHEALFRLLCAMADRGVTPDPVTVLSELERRRMEESVGGVAYVTGLPQTCASVDNVSPTYTGRVRDLAIRRQIILTARAIEAQAQESADEGDVIAARGADMLTGVGGRRVGDAWRSYADAIPDQVVAIGRRTEAPGEIVGVRTGIEALDLILLGLKGGDSIVLAGRPAMGKTAVAQQIGDHVAATQGPVGIFQLEMSEAGMAERSIVRDARVHATAVKTGRISESEWRQVMDAGDRLARLPVHVDTTPGLSITQIRTRARALKARVPGLRLIIVDYLQLIGTEGKAGSREQEVAKISRGLKLLAKELDVPIVTLGQLSRGCESREDKRPMPSDLRESGAIEQDADVILFVYRDEVYTKEACTKPGIAELIVAKNRSGEMGTAETRWVGKHQAFDPVTASPPDAGRWAGSAPDDDDRMYR
jgi:replicative DNA helicase